MPPKLRKVPKDFWRIVGTGNLSSILTLLECQKIVQNLANRNFMDPWQKYNVQQLLDVTQTMPVESLKLARAKFVHFLAKLPPVPPDLNNFYPDIEEDVETDDSEDGETGFITCQTGRIDASGQNRKQQYRQTRRRVIGPEKKHAVNKSQNKKSENSDKKNSTYSKLANVEQTLQSAAKDVQPEKVSGKRRYKRKNKEIDDESNMKSGNENPSVNKSSAAEDVQPKNVSGKQRYKRKHKEIDDESNMKSGIENLSVDKSSAAKDVQPENISGKQRYKRKHKEINDESNMKSGNENLSVDKSSAAKDVQPENISGKQRYKRKHKEINDESNMKSGNENLSVDKSSAAKDVQPENISGKQRYKRKHKEINDESNMKLGNENPSVDKSSAAKDVQPKNVSGKQRYKRKHEKIDDESSMKSCNENLSVDKSSAAKGIQPKNVSGKRRYRKKHEEINDESSMKSGNENPSVDKSSTAKETGLTKELRATLNDSIPNSDNEPFKVKSFDIILKDFMKDPEANNNHYIVQYKQTLENKKPQNNSIDKKDKENVSNIEVIIINDSDDDDFNKGAETDNNFNNNVKNKNEEGGKDRNSTGSHESENTCLEPQPVVSQSNEVDEGNNLKLPSAENNGKKGPCTPPPSPAPDNYIFRRGPRTPSLSPPCSRRGPCTPPGAAPTSDSGGLEGHDVKTRRSGNPHSFRASIMKFSDFTKPNAGIFARGYYNIS